MPGRSGVSVLSVVTLEIAGEMRRSFFLPASAGDSSDLRGRITERLDDPGLVTGELPAET